MQQTTLLLNTPTPYIEEDFIRSPANQRAMEWIEQWPNWPSHALLVYGPAGCGKTHLAHIWAEKTGAPFLNLQHVYRLQPAELQQSPRCFIVDGIETIGDEAAFLHFFNMVKEYQGHILLTSQKPAGQLTIRLPDLRSRLHAMSSVAIDAPDDMVLRAVIMKQFADKQLRVDIDVVDFLVARVERSFIAAQELVQLIDRKALEAKRRITVPFVRTVVESEI